MLVQALEHSLFGGAIQAARLFVVVVDSSGSVITAVGDPLPCLGVEFHGLIGTSLRARLPGGLTAADLDALLDVGAPEHAVEAHHIAPDGNVSTFFIQATTQKVQGDAFRSLCMVNLATFGVSRSTLHELRARLDALNAAVIVVDAHAHDLPILYVNRRFEQLTGYTGSEVLGRNCRFLQGTSTEPQAVAQLRESIAMRQVCRVVITNYRKDGSAFENELTVTPVFDAEGAITQYIGIIRERSVRVIPAPPVRL